ncbi:hypothetical protein Pfo_031497 [Paulownia fortunei]|nr:hypothetical protein Pfo_031497 [Paulownia fortunei]
MSKKVELKRTLMNLKDLIEAGLLEGLHVNYIQGSKVKYLIINIIFNIYRAIQHIP